MKVAVYDLYWSTLGGGEQVDGTIAQVLAAAGHDVTLLGPEVPDVERTRQRLGVDLAACGYQRVTDDLEASAASADYDLFVNGTYLSTAINRAAEGWYYVHFPGIPMTRAQQIRNRAFMGVVKAFGRPDRLPEGLREWQAIVDRRIVRTPHLGSYRRYLANSQFTARWVTRIWGVPSDVLYPPVRPTIAPGDKRSLILSVGRFFDPVHGHCKKQLELAEAFGELHRSGRAEGWELALVGGASAADRDYVLSVRRAAQGLPITVRPNAPGREVEELFAQASIFWHAGGFGEDPERHPERFEHFGIALIEAMAAGAVPVVFGAAGPAEIVRDGVDGVQWQRPDGLVEATVELVAEPDRRAAMSASSIIRAKDFSATAFAERLTGLLPS